MIVRFLPRLDPRRLSLLPALALFGVAAAMILGPNGSAPAQGEPGQARGAEVSRDPAVVRQTAIDLAHAACFADDVFPSAKKCQPCHEDHFREWSVSQHAYAQLSPVFNAFSNKLLKLTNGTNGDFCI